MAVSLAIVSPTLAVSLNPQAVVEQVGGAIPLVYLVALIPVLLIAGGFAILASRYGSVASHVPWVAVGGGDFRRHFFSRYPMAGPGGVP